MVVENGKVTDRVVRVPSGKGKPLAIREVIARTPDAVFGNSIWDADMLEIARHPFAINPTTELLAIATQRGGRFIIPNQCRFIVSDARVPPVLHQFSQRVHRQVAGVRRGLR